MAPLRFVEGVLLEADGSVASMPEYAVVGHPVEHSLSPQLHEAALRARGIDARYRAIDVAPEALGTFLRVAWDQGARGLNLTVPHKRAVLAEVAACSDECSEIGAANTLARRRQFWFAHNTDARGLALALQRWWGPALPAVAAKVAVIGSGGAARAALAAARALGAVSIRVLARRPERAAWAAERGARIFGMEESALAPATLVLQCTPVGLDPDEPAVIGLQHCAPSTAVLDLTYCSRPNALEREARARGLPYRDGRGMLVAQAALSFSMWLGALPPLDEMAAAIGLDP